MARGLRVILILLLAHLFTCVAADEPCAGPTVTGPVPAEQTFCPGAAVQLTITATGSEPLSYQWYRGSSMLADGPRHCGATRPVLTILSALPEDTGDDYHCLVTNACGTADSGLATLSVAVEPADVSGDCVVDSADVLHFAQCRMQSGPSLPAPAGCQTDDLDGDGDVDQDDFGVLQRGYGSRVGTARVIARDIAFVLDLSLSQAYENCLVSYRAMEIANRELWAYLWDTSLAPQTTERGLPAGPYLGNMTTWGSTVTGPDWDPASDLGLQQLKRGSQWLIPADYVNQSLSNRGYGAYTAEELAVIRSPTGAGSESSPDQSTQRANYRRRVLVALGLYRWKSGKTGGQAGGNGNDLIDAGEVEPLVPYPSSASNPDTFCRPIGGSWDGFVDYVSDITLADDSTSDTGLTYRFLRYDPPAGLYGNPMLRWRFGLKTFVDYVQMMKYTRADSPGLAGAPQQPLTTAIDGIRKLADTLQSRSCTDQFGLVAFGQIGYGPGEKPDHLSWVTSEAAAITGKLDQMQAAMWSGNSNTAQGIDQAAGTGAVATGALGDLAPGRRSGAARVIILVTDGTPNIPRNGTINSAQDPAQATADAIQAATDAAALGIQLHVIGVGMRASQPDAQQFFASIAQAGGGSFFIASGDPATYHTQLLDLIQRLPQ